MRIRVEIRFLGAFRRLAGVDRLSLEVECSNIRNLIKALGKSFPSENRKLLIDHDLDDPRPNALILLNGCEISVLKGLETELTDGDEITLIPVVHGG